MIVGFAGKVTDYNLREARRTLAEKLTRVQPYAGLQET